MHAKIKKPMEYMVSDCTCPVYSTKLNYIPVGCIDSIPAAHPQKEGNVVIWTSLWQLGLSKPWALYVRCSMLRMAAGIMAAGTMVAALCFCKARCATD